MSTSDEMIAKMQVAARNPIAIARTIVRDVEERSEGNVSLANPMNPYIHLVDMASCLGSAAIRTNKQLNRQHYPNAADTLEDMYHHLSDADMVDLFSSPSETTMVMMYQRDELISRMVPVGSGNVSKLTIGKHTKWNVADMDFGILYPIDIRLMAHGSLQITYDGSEDNPMGALESNRLNWRVRNLGRNNGGQMVEIEVPVKQFKRQTYKATLSGSAQFSKEYEFEDQFYHCRAYMATRTGEWREIGTTHSDQIFDVTKTTLQLQVLDGRLKVTLPYVYYSSGLADTELRIDIYSTKGPREMSLASYAPNSFTVRYEDLDSPANRRFISPLSNFITSTCYNTGMLLGGSNAITVNDLKERIRNNSVGRNTIPVTPAQIETELKKIGFGAVLAVDNITDRVFLATRKLPAPIDLLGESAENSMASTSPAGSTMMMLTSDLDSLKNIDGVIDNGQRMTLTPRTLFRNNGGVLQVIQQDEFEALNSLERDVLVARLNADDFLYTPLHYVLDITGEQFVSRPYYFGIPVVDRRNFVDDNETTGVGVNSSIITMEKLPDNSGWRLLLQTDTDASFKELADEKVHVQIGINDAEGTGMVYMDGTLLGKNADDERIYEFLITTNWDISADQHLTLTSFDMLDGVRNYPVELISKIHVFYLAEDVRGFNYESKWFDNEVGDFFYENEVSAVYYETFDIKFGDNLEGLWTRSRTVPGSQEYRLYEEDVLEYYREDVYKEENGQRVIEMVDGVLGWVKLHEQGDPVMEDGVQLIAHRKGTLMLDSFGKPVLVSERKVVQQTDLFLVDASYYFVTGDLDIEYAQRLPETLVLWINDYLGRFRPRHHSKTEVYLHPMSTVGQVEMMVGSSKQINISAEQTLMVEFHVRSIVYKDVSVRRDMEQSCTLKIAELLDGVVVSEDMIESTLRTLLGDDVISVKLYGLGGDTGYTTFTAVDGGGRMCIGKRPIVSSDGNITVADAISYSFIDHTA